MLIGQSHIDFSGDLRDVQDWTLAHLAALDFCLDAAVLAIDAVSRLLAVGTLHGVIHIIGAPGVHAKIDLPTATPIKFLEFATSLYKLVCIDDNDKFYLWDLTSLGKVKLEVTTRIERPVTYLSLSPVHTHAFISLESGEVRAYDLLCRRFSNYTVPNAWDMYAKSLQADGMVVDTDGGSRIPTQVVTHPRNPALLFIAYGGGVALVDLKDHNTSRVYELLIPAGAPGGAGYTDPDLLKHRRPPVTTLTLHPSGHLFAVGHADGSLAFWAIDDDEQPLSVRTLDDVNVNLVDGTKLDEYLPGSVKTPSPHNPREPIFKLAWSGYPNSKDPRGGETSLLILGGQFSHDAPGVNVLWLPAFNPTEPPAAASVQRGLHPHFRQAMQNSLDPLDAYFYQTAGLTHDFLLVPQDNPHFSGAWEPSAVVLISESAVNTRAVEAYEFPPPSFPAHVEPRGKAVQIGSDASLGVESDLADALRDLQASSDPKILLTPEPLWSGPSGIIGAQLCVIDRFAYDKLSSFRREASLEFTLHGGVMVADEQSLADIKAAKFEPHRIIITQHIDQTIRFLDISAQLLTPPSETIFVSPFPQSLPSLSVEPLAVLGHPSVRSRMPDDYLQATIQSIHFMSEALEISFTLTTGAVITYRLRDGPITDFVRELEDDELVSLDHISVGTGLRFKPSLLILSSTPASAFSTTEIGFSAVGYADKSMKIVDMRGPRVLYRVQAERESRRRSISQLLHKPHNQPVGSFVWTICSLSSDTIPKVRLVAIGTAGDTSMYTLFRAQSGEWAVSPEVAHSETIASLPSMHGGMFVLDGRMGAQLRADKNRLTVALEKEQSRTRSPTPKGRDIGAGELKSILVVVGAKGARCYGDLTGDKRIGKTDWGAKNGLATYAQIVERSASCVLVVVTDKSQALVYSLPSLDYLHSFPLPTPSLIPPSIDATGDILTLTAVPTPVIVLDTFFNIRRGYHTPLFSLSERRDGTTPRAPAPPAPVSLGPEGWLANASSLFGQLTGAGTGVMNGAEIDTLLAGPDRPVPEKPVPRPQKEEYKEWTADTARTTANMTEQTQSSLYQRLHAAVAERGEALGELEQNFNALGEGSKNMVDQAKRLAAQQGAKSWFRSWGGGL